jgi:radical SAM superfamily enzyme YgiQ (UPF0313 family)
MNVLLISTYDLGRQPFGLASAAAWLQEAGLSVEALDLAVSEIDEAAVRRADAIAMHLPMHTATRIALATLPRLRELNPTAALCAWGLYAAFSQAELEELGVSFLAAGEAEPRLTEHLVALRDGRDSGGAYRDLQRLAFRTPVRDRLPALREYAHLNLPDGSSRVVGSTEASRGCRHVCRHCPIVPVYGGRFRVVDPQVVLADVTQQVEAGAAHITFGDADFFNGPRHAVAVVELLHRHFPELTYDVTIKVEHLLRHRQHLPHLVATGCTLVTSAVESIDPDVLARLDKGHTVEDFVAAVALCRELGLSLQPTFLPFTPWTSIDGYAELLRTLVDLDLVGQVPPIQLAIRLLIPRESRLLELPEVEALVGAYDPERLVLPWEHEDAAVDALQLRIEGLVDAGTRAGAGRAEVFGDIWAATREAQAEAARLPQLPAVADRATIPYLSEPWYC